MKHAGPGALDRLEPILRVLCKVGGLKEKSRGIFYRGSRAFLHFHEHSDELYADAKLGDDFERLPATSSAERAALLRTIKTALKR